MATSPVSTDQLFGGGGKPSGAVSTSDLFGKDSESSGTPISTTEDASPKESMLGELVDMGKLGTSLVYSQLFGMDPHFAHQNHDEITKRLSDIAPDFAARIGKAATVKDDPLYMMMKHKGPEPFESHDVLENFIHDVSEFAGDPAIWGPALVGSLAGGPVGARVGTSAGFALDAGLRKALMDHYQKGTAVSFGDVASRTAATIWASAKGLATGEAMQFAGAIPVPKAIGDVAGNVLRGLYQSSAMTVAGGVLDGQVPKVQDFERSAVMVTGLGLVTHAATVVLPKQGLMDVYAKDGTTPEQSATKLQAQPPVKPEPPEGLHPVIRLTAKDGTTQVIHADPGETHAELAQRVTGVRPTSIEELDANPKLADKVLSQPEVQDQSVIDRAMEITGDASLNAGDENAYLKRPPEPPKSGRGFSSSDGQYMNRKQSQKWVKENQPDVHDMWTNITGDDKAEFHSQDYKEASDRVAQRNVLEGEPKLNGVSGELQEFLAGNREELNGIKASDGKIDAYGKSVIRSTYVNVRNFVRVSAEQTAGHIAKLLPDYVDQEALSFMRDYRDDPEQLRAEIETIRSGDNERLKASIPSMERALEPTPKMLEADKQLTSYFTQANDLRRQFVGTSSSIDPERYSPRNFMLTEEGEEKGTGGGRFSKRSSHDIRREYLHVLDPLKSGDVQARTFNAVDELRVYGDRLANSVATSVFQMELKNTELGKFGAAGQLPAELKAQMPDTNMLTSKEIEEFGGIPKDWVDIPGTSKTIMSNGKQMQVGFKVPPKIAEAMSPILEKDVLSGAQYWKAAKLAQGYIKAVELGLSPFHMRALSISFMNNAGIDAYRNALTTSNNSPEFEAQERKAALYGVTTTKTGVPIEAYQGLKASSFADKSPGAIREGFDKVFKGMTKATFDVAQRKFKVIDFSAKEAQWLAKHPNATETEYGTAMRGISKEINAVYGGLNWEVMGVSKNFQAIARMFLLAPDWTFSNVANLKYAGEGGAAGNAARAFWAKSFVTGYAMTQGMSLFVTGQMSDQWDKVYLGKDDKGKKMYSSMFFVGAPKDAIGTINSTMRGGFPAGTIAFAVNKAAPLFGTGIREIENKDWQGKPIVNKGDTFTQKTGKELGFAAEQLLPAPFAIKDIVQQFSNPDDALSYKDFLAAVAGASVYHEKPKGTIKSQLRYSIRKKKSE